MVGALINFIEMTFRQRIMKLFYPLLMFFSKKSGKSAVVLKNEKNKKPVQSIYDLSVPLNNGNELKLKEYAGKKILLVNTASNCGFTDQYDDLQKLYTAYQKDLVVIGFPANDFKEQEKGDDEEIAQFCKLNYGISFPLSKKSVVIKSSEQNPVFRWLSDRNKNGWNDQPPTWNFSKYLVNEEGVLTHYFAPGISPAEIFKLT
jgi:glutathione peroxidase